MLSKYKDIINNIKSFRLDIRNASHILALVIIIFFVVTLGTYFVVSSYAYTPTATDYTTLQNKWHDLLTGGTLYDPNDPDIANQISKITSQAQSTWNTLNKSASRTYLWSDLTSTTISGQITTAYARIETMALAYSTTGSPLQGNTSLSTDITNAMNWMNTNRYSTSKSQYDNWWDWQIGAPSHINNIVTLMYSNLSSAQRTTYLNAVDHFTPSLISSDTGANRVWKATVIALRGILVQDNSKILAARDGLSQVFLYVTSNDGFYIDGSFVQHKNQAATGAYGGGLIFDLANMMYLLNGSPWSITDPNQKNVYQWVYNSFGPLIYKGAIMDMTMGRVISRPDSQDHVDGAGIIAAIIRLSQSASPSDASTYKSMVKYWITADTYRSFLGNEPISYIISAKQFINDSSIMPISEPIAIKLFPSMDRAVDLQPGFGFGISMSSNRIYNFEAINKENYHGWYTGDGMTYLYNDDLGQYSDGFWPTVNPYRLPGTTIDTQTRANSSGQGYLSPNTWVGGANLNGQAASVGMDLKAWNSTLVAKKSWFLMGSEIISLGAGITSTDNRSIVTTIDNRKIDNANTDAVTVDGIQQPNTLGVTTSLTNSKWITIAGTGGYYFLQNEPISLIRESRTGAYSNINQNGSFLNTTLLTRNYATMTINHGSNPTNATYSYVVLPNLTSAQTQAYSQNPTASIVTNTATVQAVRDISQQLFGVNFWKAATASYLTSQQPASVMIKEGGSNYDVAVSDPTQKQSTLTFTLNKTATSVASQDASITVVSLSPKITFTVNVSGAAGKSFTINFVGVQDIIPTTTITPSAPTNTPIPSSSITLRTTATGNNGSGNTSLTLNKPSGVKTGDVLIAQIAVSNTPSITTQSGWNLIQSTIGSSATSSTVKMESYYKVAGSSEPTTYQWTFNSSQAATGGISAFIGVNNSNPIDASSGRANGSTATVTFSQVTTTTASDMLVALIGVSGNNLTETQPSGFTKIYDVNNTTAGSGKNAEASMFLFNNIGLTNIGTGTESAGSHNNVAQLIALKTQ